MKKTPTFIITRPAHQADYLHQQIKKAGGNCILFPTIEILSTCNPQKLNPVLNNQAKINKIIFVSANAVYAVMPHLQKTIMPPIYAIGPGTANALRDYQINAKIPADGHYNSEGLLALPDMQFLSEQSVIIFSGEGGRTLLAESLRQRGAKVEKIAVYQRAKPAKNLSEQVLKDWQAQTITAIIVTSAESLKNLHAMADLGKEWLCQQRLLVISPTMQVLAKQLGFMHQPLVADNASDEAILRVLFDNRE